MSRLEEQARANAAGLVIDVSVEEHELARQQFDVRQRQRKRKRIAGGAATAAAVVMTAVWFAPRGSPEVPVQIAAHNEGELPAPTHFDDGSTALVLAPSTTLKTLTNRPELLEVRLASGEARFEITPNPKRLFRVHTRHARIEVLGTSFTVKENDRSARVTVHEGRVAVLSGTERHELTAGMMLEVGDTSLSEVGVQPSEIALAEETEEAERDVDDEASEETEAFDEEPEPKVSKRKRRRRSKRARQKRARTARRAATTKAPALPLTAAEAPTPVDDTPAVKRVASNPSYGTPPPPRRSARAWTRLAKSGDYSAAYDAMKDAPEPVLNQTAELMLAADVARLSGHPLEAVPLLKRVLANHPQDPRAVLAAFTLGRIQRRQLGHPRSAAQSFATARRLAPQGSLAADALAHEAECLHIAGEAANARDRAREYLRLFPEGRKADSMRRMGGAP